VRFPLDVNESRAGLQCVVTLRLDDGTEVALDVVDLDTGAAYAVLGPSDDIPQGLVDAAPLYVVIGAAGERHTCKRLEGSLRFEGWDFPDRVEVVVNPKFERWLLGMPVLRRFHILLPSEQLVTADEIS
jgi:hypothetical protein